jgi:hypothetical protein
MQLLVAVERGDVSARMAQEVVQALMGGDAREVSEVIRDVCGGEQLSDEAQLRVSPLFSSASCRAWGSRGSVACRSCAWS